MGEEWPTNFAWKSDFHDNFQGPLTCRKSVTWDRQLYFPSEGRRAEDFFARKIRRLWPGSNQRSWVPEASMLTTRPPKPTVLRDSTHAVQDNCIPLSKRYQLQMLTTSCQTAHHHIIQHSSLHKQLQLPLWKDQQTSTDPQSHNFVSNEVAAGLCLHCRSCSVWWPVQHSRSQDHCTLTARCLSLRPGGCDCITHIWRHGETCCCHSSQY